MKKKTDRYINRELSWLKFNSRVLEQALNKQTPILEALKFLTIFSSNQDEFFMVRVAGLEKMLKEGFSYCESPDKDRIEDILSQIKEITKHLIKQQYKRFSEIMKNLKTHGVEITPYQQTGKVTQQKLNLYFEEEVLPVLTPLAVDSSHPYPFLTNLSMYLVIEFQLASDSPSNSQQSFTGFVEIPSILPRLIPIHSSSSEQWEFILLEDLIEANLTKLFLGFKPISTATLRVTRNLDYKLLENSIVDLLKSVEKEVRWRGQQEAVRLEICGNISPKILNEMMDTLQLDRSSLFSLPAPLGLLGLMELYKLPLPQLKDPPFNPRLPPRMTGGRKIFDLIRHKDLLVHHPYESFYAVTEFLCESAVDANVLAIKQTLYRSSGDSPIVESLIKAAENGKHVTAVVELKARFDEKNNIVWARRLEHAGVHVVYGFVGLKTHCKATLIIRKEQDKLTRYAHLSTGNYNSQTAKLYTDLGLFTANDNITKDISSLFNFLTGFNTIGEKGKALSPSAIPKFKDLIVSPISLRQWTLNKIDHLILEQKKHGGSTLVAKLNALVDQTIIDKLYEASAAGVTIKLIIRGICCLRPQVSGLSDNITVISIIDRFLEHSRIYYFNSHASEDIYLGSADWMTRNMERRIEILFPIKDDDLKERLIEEILNTCLIDNETAYQLNPDGSYALPQRNKSDRIRCQSRFIELAREDGIKSIPYNRAIRHRLDKRKGIRPIATKTS